MKYFIWTNIFFRRRVMSSCRGEPDGSPPARPIPIAQLPALFCVLLTWGLLRLLRLICQNFGQISSLSSANRASLDRARHRRNKSQYAWKTFQRIQVVKVNHFCSPPGLVITIHGDWGKKVLVKTYFFTSLQADVQNSILLHRVLLQLNGFQRRVADLEICFLTRFNLW